MYRYKFSIITDPAIGHRSFAKDVYITLDVDPNKVQNFSYANEYLDQIIESKFREELRKMEISCGSCVGSFDMIFTYTMPLAFIEDD